MHEDYNIILLVSMVPPLILLKVFIVLEFTKCDYRGRRGLSANSVCSCVVFPTIVCLCIYPRASCFGPSSHGDKRQDA